VCKASVFTRAPGLLPSKSDLSRVAIDAEIVDYLDGDEESEDSRRGQPPKPTPKPAAKAAPAKAAPAKAAPAKNAVREGTVVCAKPRFLRERMACCPPN
jgi:hypothetical protein